MLYATAVSDLLRRVPEFGEYKPAPNFDLPSDVFGSFALYLCELPREGSAGGVLKRACQVLNDMASSHDDDITNLLVVSVFEIIADDECCRDAVAIHLSEDAKGLLRRTSSGWKKPDA